ncbi:MAG: hypothetical protein ACR2QG_07600, partial [Gammaproteobacteria bacterium]
ANLERLQGRYDNAEAGYLTALKLNPKFVPGYVNLSDLYREWLRESEAEQTLRNGLKRLPEQAYLHHALGLSLVRQQRLEEAILELKIAAELPDATARFAAVYVIALDSTGENDAAREYLQSALRRFNNHPELLEISQSLQQRE